VLDHYDHDKLAEIERQLIADDPDFVERMRVAPRQPHPRRRRPASVLVTIVMLCAMLPFFLAGADWTALTLTLIAIAGVETGWRAWCAVQDAHGPTC
jgi:hypothetical protein